MSVHDEAEFPWLGAEKAFLRAALRAGKLTLAICLGAQLVAQALGGEVRANPAPEIGFWTVRFAAKALTHPLLRGWPEKATVLHWHLDTFTVPPGAVRVGMSAGCAAQGFVWGDGIIGLQFHPEMTEEMVEKLITFENHDTAEEQEFVQTAAQIRSKLKSVWKGRLLLENAAAKHGGVARKRVKTGQLVIASKAKQSFLIVRFVGFTTPYSKERLLRFARNDGRF